MSNSRAFIATSLAEPHERGSRYDNKNEAAEEDHQYRPALRSLASTVIGFHDPVFSSVNSLMRGRTDVALLDTRHDGPPLAQISCSGSRPGMDPNSRGAYVVEQRSGGGRASCLTAAAPGAASLLRSVYARYAAAQTNAATVSAGGLFGGDMITS